MDFDPTCLDFLDHFDRPQTAGAVYAQSPQSDTFDPRLVETVDDDEVAPSPHLPTRDGRWVLQWAAAAAVLLIAVGGATQFAYIVAAEHTLNLAARAGVTEATLPRATYQSITAAVERQLVSYSLQSGQLQITLLQNGAPVGRQFRARDGDRISLTISVPASATLPAWLSKLSPWHSEAPTSAQAERDVPGRKLRIARS